MEYLDFDTTKWKFKETVEKILGSRLTTLESGYKLFTRKEDQSSRWHKVFYENNEEFLLLYRKFIDEVIRPMFDEEIIYQKIPTFRVQLQNNVSVGEFHRDRDYGHSQGEINFFLPFTDTNEFNSVWVESEEGKEDYKPQMLKYGQILKFDSFNLKHGNKLNTSDSTRVSVDFRIVQLSKYVESDTGSINMGTKFKIGGYYERY